MLIFIFNDAILALLEKFVDVALHIMIDDSFHHLLLEFGLLSDVNKIKHLVKDLIDSPVVLTINNFTTAMHYLQASKDEKKIGSSAKKYFNQAIIESQRVMSLKHTSIENYVTCMQIQAMSQLFVDEYEPTCSLIDC